MGKRLTDWTRMKRLKDYGMKEIQRSREETDERLRHKRAKFYHWL